MSHLPLDSCGLPVGSRVCVLEAVLTGVHILILISPTALKQCGARSRGRPCLPSKALFNYRSFTFVDRLLVELPPEDREGDALSAKCRAISIFLRADRRCADNPHCFTSARSGRRRAKAGHDVAFIWLTL